MSYHPYLGDVAIETSFADYEEVDGVRLPRLLRTTIDKYPQFELRVSANRLGAGGTDADELAAPDAVKTAPLPEAPPVEVTAQEVAEGVWWLAGSGNHRSILFEFDDHLTLFEVPLGEARTLAVIAEARSLRPDKPLTEAIVSHHHPDHAGGVRAAIAEGLRIITHQGNATFFEELAARRHTIEQDALARNPRPLELLLVDDELTLEDDSMEVRLYHVRNDSHIDTMIFAYVPGPRLLVQADLYDVGWLRQPWAATYLENVGKRRLQVETDVPVHGRIQPHAEVVELLEGAVVD
jgi:glyoxylase-like metal-dependent hydrolase (beta-lactamase superfamily II)